MNTDESVLRGERGESECYQCMGLTDRGSL